MDKTEQTRRKLINTAKLIIQNEGIENLSIRKLADKAGYSSSALYTHFKSTEELIYYCLSEFLDESSKYIKSTIILGRGIMRLKEITFSLTNYFLDNRNLYIALFSKKNINNMPASLADKIFKPIVQDLFLTEVKYVLKDKFKSDEELAILSIVITDSLMITLLFYLLNADCYEDSTLKKKLFEDIEKKIDFYFKAF